MVFVAKWQGIDDRVRLVSITHGAEFEIDLTGFTDPTPAFGYVDDYKGSVKVLQNLSIDGNITTEDRPAFMWLQGPRECVLLRATGGEKASFRSLTVGEFCVEIYYVRPDGSAELIHQNDFCFK
jgi:hypothetical protein